MLHIYHHTLFWSPAEADSGKIINSTSEVLRCFHSRPPPSLLTSGADNITAEVTGPTCTPAHRHGCHYTPASELLPSQMTLVMWLFTLVLSCVISALCCEEEVLLYENIQSTEIKENWDSYPLGIHHGDYNF